MRHDGVDDIRMEALGILQEEAAEIIKEVSKVRRSGANFKPFDGKKTNMDNLQAELYDFLIVVELAGLRLEIPTEFRREKLAKLRTWSNIVR